MNRINRKQKEKGDKWQPNLLFFNQEVPEFFFLLVLLLAIFRLCKKKNTRDATVR